MGIYACHRGLVSLRNKGLVCAAGPVGIVNLLEAKTMKAAQMVMTGTSSSLLAKANKVGTYFTIQIAKETLLEIASKVESLLRSKPEVTTDVTGAESSMHKDISCHSLRWDVGDYGKGL